MGVFFGGPEGVIGLDSEVEAFSDVFHPVGVEIFKEPYFSGDGAGSDGATGFLEEETIADGDLAKRRTVDTGQAAFHFFAA